MASLGVPRRVVFLREQPARSLFYVGRGNWVKATCQRNDETRPKVHELKSTTPLVIAETNYSASVAYSF